MNSGQDGNDNYFKQGRNYRSEKLRKPWSSRHTWWFDPSVGGKWQTINKRRASCHRTFYVFFLLNSTLFSVISLTLPWAINADMGIPYELKGDVLGQHPGLAGTRNGHGPTDWEVSRILSLFCSSHSQRVGDIIITDCSAPDSQKELEGWGRNLNQTVNPAVPSPCMFSLCCLPPSVNKLKSTS